jgi:dihydroorotate dehydrogenase (NAD+) catalytic subunit
MVHQCYRALKIPVIGCGGSPAPTMRLNSCWLAPRQSVGTASFIDPGIMQKIIHGIEDYCTEHRISRVRDIIGQVNIDEQLASRWYEFAQ